MSTNGERHLAFDKQSAMAATAYDSFASAQAGQPAPAAARSSAPRHGEASVIAFPLRAVLARKGSSFVSSNANQVSNVVELPRQRAAASDAKAVAAKAEATSAGDDDYGHRMAVNLFAAAALLALIVSGERLLTTLVTVS